MWSRVAVFRAKSLLETAVIFVVYCGMLVFFFARRLPRKMKRNFVYVRSFFLFLLKAEGGIVRYVGL